MRLHQTTKVWPAPIQGLNKDAPGEMVGELQSPDLVNVYHHEGFLKKALGYAKNTSVALTLNTVVCPIGKIYDYIKANGTSVKVAEAIQTGGTGGSQRHVVKHDGTSWSTTAVLSGLDATAEINFATFGDLLIICNGVDANKVWDGTTVYNLGVTTPTDTLGAPAEAAGNIPDGTYKYVYTYRNSVTDFESQPYNYSSPRSVTYASGPKKGTFTAPNNATAGDGVDKWRLYRTVVGGADGGPYYFVAEAAVAVNIEDNLTDATLGAQHPVDYDKFPICRYPHVWRKRLWLAWNTSNRSTAYYSKVDKPAYCPQALVDTAGDINYENVALEDGDTLTGVGDIGQIIVFTKNRSIHPYLYAGYDSFQNLGPIKDHGCTNHRSLISQGGGLWMADYQGVWFFDTSGRSVLVSRRVDNIFKSMSASAKNKYHAVWYEPFSFYILFYVQTGSTYTDACLIFDTRGQRVRSDRVGIFEMKTLSSASGTASVGSGMVTDANGEPKIWIGGSEGHSYLFFKASTYAFDGQDYTSYFKTKQFQIHPHWTYRYREGIITTLSDGAWQAGAAWTMDFGKRAGGSRGVNLAPEGTTATWTYQAGAATWTYGGNPASWALATIQVTDAVFEMEGEGNTLQFTISNSNNGENYSVSKLGVRAQLKKVT